MGYWLKWRVGLCVVVCLVLIGTVAPTYAQLVLMTIEGRVTDHIDGPVEGALVFGGGDSALTDETGWYRLEVEGEPRNVQIHVSRSGFEPKSRWVSPIEAMSDVDVALYYKARLSVSPRAFNNDPPQTLQIEVLSYAPADACVVWTDERSGEEVVLALGEEVEGGESRWEGQFSVAAGTEDGVYGHTSQIFDCPTDTALSLEVGRSYIVDSVAPVIEEMFPRDWGHTAFLNQPLMAQISDDGSGVDPDSIRFRLTNEQTNESVEYGVQAYSAQTGLARSPDTVLAMNTTYEVEVSVADFAGNQALAVMEHISVLEIDVASDALVEIPETASTEFRANTASPMTREFTFRDIDMTVGGHHISRQGILSHAGIGFVLHDINLRDGWIHLYTRVTEDEYVELPGSPIRPPASWGNRVVYGQVADLQKDALETQLAIGAVEVLLPKLSVEVTAAADKVVLAMETQSRPSVPVCRIPHDGCDEAVWPTPDPLPFYVSEEDAAMLVEWEGRNEEEFLSASGLGAGTADAIRVGLVYHNLLDASDNTWDLTLPVAPDEQLAMWALEYVHEYPVNAPSLYASDCLVLPCTHAAAAESGSEEKCLNEDEMVEKEGRRCHQWVQVSVRYSRQSSEWFWVGGYMGATKYGFNQGDWDEFALGLTNTQQTSGDWTDVDPAAVWHKWTRTASDVCINEQSNRTSQPSGLGAVTTRFRGAPHWSYMIIDPLPQYTQWNAPHDVDYCMRREAGTWGYYRDRLMYASHIGRVRLEFSGGEHEATIQTGYGHNKTVTRWNFGCGVGFSYPGYAGVSCGWSPEADQERVWTARSPKLVFDY